MAFIPSTGITGFVLWKSETEARPWLISRLKDDTNSIGHGQIQYTGGESCDKTIIYAYVILNKVGMQLCEATS